MLKTNLVNLNEMWSLDALNMELDSAVSVATELDDGAEQEYTPEELAWFRRPVREVV